MKNQYMATIIKAKDAHRQTRSAVEIYFTASNGIEANSIALQKCSDRKKETGLEWLVLRVELV